MASSPEFRDRGTKHALETQDSPVLEKFRKTSSAGKVMTTVFWDCYSVMVLEKGNTIKREYHPDELRQLTMQPSKRDKGN